MKKFQALDFSFSDKILDDIFDANMFTFLWKRVYSLFSNIHGLAMKTKQFWSKCSLRIVFSIPVKTEI